MVTVVSSCPVLESVLVVGWSLWEPHTLERISSSQWPSQLSGPVRSLVLHNC